MHTMVRQGFIRIAVLASTTIHGLTFLGSILMWTVIYLLTSQVEYDRFNNSTGKYEVVLTYPKLYHFMPAMPGQGSDISGSIAIYDRDGNFYGGDSLDFLQDGYHIEWIDHGASLKFVGEWDFEAGTYAYWSDDGTELIVEKVRK